MSEADLIQYLKERLSESEKDIKDMKSDVATITANIKHLQTQFKEISIDTKQALAQLPHEMTEAMVREILKNTFTDMLDEDMKKRTTKSKNYVWWIVLAFNIIYIIYSFISNILIAN